MTNPLDIALQRGKLDIEELRYKIWKSKDLYNEYKTMTIIFKENSIFNNPGFFELSREDQFRSSVEKTLKRREVMNLSYKNKSNLASENAPDQLAGGVGYYMVTALMEITGTKSQKEEW